MHVNKASLSGDGNRNTLLEEFDQAFADSVAKYCHTKYLSLPKTGKPKTDSEWTMLSAVVKVHHKEDMEVVSLATGSKCIGVNKMSHKGDILNDSHAEVLARRGFLRYLYDQIHQLENGSTSKVILKKGESKYAIRQGVSFHFYCSHTPCGDASIFPKVAPSLTDVSDDYGACISNEFKRDTSTEKIELKTGQKRNNREEDCGGSPYPRRNSGDGAISEPKSKQAKFGREHPNISSFCEKNNSGCWVAALDVNHGKCEDKDSEGPSGDATVSRGETHAPESLLSSKICGSVPDIHRTGAKCVVSEIKQDEHLPGVAYHVLGAVRTKPGRGDPTLSVSCSDKLLRWNCVGLQGALLSQLISEPVYVKSVVIGGKCPFSAEALKRALVDRVSVDGSQLPPIYKVNNPVFLQASIPFPDGRIESRSSQPCPSSLVWCLVPNRSLEVAVEGKKQGATKKSQHTQAGRLLVSKVELLRHFDLLNKIGSANYSDVKARAVEYKSAWELIRKSSNLVWTTKPLHLLHFGLQEDSLSFKCKEKSKMRE